MTTIQQLQSNVASSQANLQKTSIELAHAQANLNAQELAGHSIVSAQDDVADAKQNHQVAQNQLNSDQSALDAALTASPQTVSPNPAVAPANAQAPQTTSSINNEQTINYGTPSGSQLTAEAASKLASTGLTSSVSNITSGIKIVNSNGSSKAVNIATGQTVANLGTINSTGNTLPPNALPISKNDFTSKFKAILTQEPFISNDPAGNSVIFYVMPTISENGEANYKSFTPTQHPGEILKYEGSSSRVWGISTKLISWNVSDADRNQKYMNLIRSWRMPFYGIGTGSTPQTSQYLGAPPPVLTFQAYGDKAIGPVKCVLLQYNWTWPNDVDYIRTSNGEPFPVVIDISLSLKDDYSPAEYSSFNLLQYRSGNLKAAFGSVLTSQLSALSSSTRSSKVNPSSIDTSSASNISLGQVFSANSSANSSIKSASAGTSAVLSSDQLQGSQQIQNIVGNA